MTTCEMPMAHLEQIQTDCDLAIKELSGIQADSKLRFSTRVRTIKTIITNIQQEAEMAALSIAKP